jgi:hypothetical protein
MQAEAFGRVSLAGAAACRTAACQNSTAFYQSLNHASRVVIGIASRIVIGCVFGSQKPGPWRAGLAEGETPLDTPQGARNERRA